MKESYYNFIYNDLGKNKIVMYNSRTGALAIVKEEQYSQFKQYLDNGVEIKDKDFLNKLLQCGYLIPLNVDEKFLIEQKLLRSRYHSKVLSITIAPTMACNFRCIYCFEQGHYGKVMESETADNLIKFIANKIAGMKAVKVTWFGGEPLLAMPVIKRLSKEIMQLCKNNDIKYSAIIITNGYLLTEEIAKELKQNNVIQAQITLDGTKKIHDSRRMLLNGNGTYDTIIKNLIDTKGILPIILRINVDYDNIDMASEVVKFLKDNDLLNNVIPYLGFVMSYNGNYEEEKCLSNEIYSKANLQFLIKNSFKLENIYPVPRGNYCGADNYSAWTIDDKGYIYKCWNEIGMSNYSIGNVNNGINYLQDTRILCQYMRFNPLKNKECSECKMLPFCMGGCPHNRADGQATCENRRYTLKEYILECTMAILNNKR